MWRIPSRPTASAARGRQGQRNLWTRRADGTLRGNAIGAELPLFGTHNAGEIGPANLADRQPGAMSSGVGWHVMFTVLGW